MRTTPHVLVVDDDPTVRSFVEAVLDRSGFRVSMAGNFKEAGAKATDEEDVAVLVSDLVLGGDCAASTSTRRYARFIRP